MLSNLGIVKKVLEICIESVRWMYGWLFLLSKHWFLNEDGVKRRNVWARNEKSPLFWDYLKTYRDTMSVGFERVLLNFIYFKLLPLPKKLKTILFRFKNLFKLKYR